MDAAVFVPRENGGNRSTGQRLIALCTASAARRSHCPEEQSNDVATRIASRYGTLTICSRFVVPPAPNGRPAMTVIV